MNTGDVMDKAQELSRDASAARANVSEGKRLAKAAQELVQQLLDDATAHGWNGVVSSARPAMDHLEDAFGALVDAENDCEAAGEVFDGVTDQMTTPEVKTHLERASADLNHGSTAMSEAITAADRAHNTLRDAGEPESAMQATQDLQNFLEEAKEYLDKLEVTTQTEADNADSWGAVASGN